MKLSEAIRLGAMLKPQAIGLLLSSDGRSCAVGSALDAIGELKGDLQREYNVAKMTWPILQTVVRMPVSVPYCVMPTLVLHAIWDLNDAHEWSREQIADWVESIERAQETVIGSGTEVTMEPALTTSRSEAPKVFS